MRARGLGSTLLAGTARHAAARAFARAFAVLGTPVMIAIMACGPSEPATDIREWTDDMAFRISVSPLPPVSEGITTFKIVVKDKETGQPIETGQGRLFARNVEGAMVGNGLDKGKEVGTYYARVRFPVSGEWSVAMQFRRDSTKKLEDIQDWRQTVNPAPSPTRQLPASPDSTP